MASALTLHVHATCVPNIDCQSPTVPMYLDLCQVVTLIHEDLGQLGTRPVAKDCATG